MKGQDGAGPVAQGRVGAHELLPRGLAQRVEGESLVGRLQGQGGLGDAQRHLRVAVQGAYEQAFQVAPFLFDPDPVVAGQKTAAGDGDGDVEGTPGRRGQAPPQGSLGFVQRGAGRLHVHPGVRRQPSW